MTATTDADVLAERFEALVWKDDPAGCWVWTGHRTKHGRPLLVPSSNRRLQVLAQRWAYQAARGDRPADVAPTCGNRLCCNPDHLEPTAGPRGSAIASAKLTESEAAHLKALWQDRALNGHTQRSLSAEFGVCVPQVAAIAAGRNWAHVAAKYPDGRPPACAPGIGRPAGRQRMLALHLVLTTGPAEAGTLAAVLCSDPEHLAGVLGCGWFEVVTPADPDTAYALSPAGWAAALRFFPSFAPRPNR